MRARTLSVGAIACTDILVAAACTKSSTKTTTSSAQAFIKGGTLHVALLSDVTAGFDPNREYYTIGFSYLRDIMRTLLSYRSLPARRATSRLPTSRPINPRSRTTR